MVHTKRTLGAYYTEKNIFTLPEVEEWLKRAGEISNILEPFAGGNNLVKMFIEAFPNINAYFTSYDLFPGKNSYPSVPIFVKDTLSDYPSGFKIAISNPPYLAKNSATRRGLPFPSDEYDDLYQAALEKMLDNSEYVAAIIPESFITQGKYFERLLSVTTLNIPMFKDTSCPACLALFVPELTDDFSCFRFFGSPHRIGSFREIKKSLGEIPKPLIKMKFNDPSGQIGLIAVDNNRSPSIKFVEGKNIPHEKIKVSSRSFTRISLELPKLPMRKILSLLNKEISKYRKETSDIFLTSFRGLRKDGFYRRRLDFRTAKVIITKALYPYL